MRSRFIAWTVLLFATAAPARAEVHCYVLIFAADGTPHTPHRSHTFATFVRRSDNVCVQGRWWSNHYRIETVTLSWLPQTLSVRALKAHPEPGVGLGLAATLQWACGERLAVSLWGPFEIQEELYCRAAARAQRLAQRGLQYKVVDRHYRPDIAIDCIHAITDLEADAGLLETGTAYGSAASALVAQHFAHWMIEPGRTHDGVLDWLGLTAWPIIRKPLGAH